MALVALEQLLKGAMGLDAVSIGSGAIARAVQERLTACHLTDIQVYLDRVRTSEPELQALIEAVVVPETWFFRDPHAFTTLARLAQQEWLPARLDGALSFLSLPCSTGEEPYSMAMALLDAGVAPARFRVDAVDISRRNLARAERGVYGRNSFRQVDLGFRDRHFAPAEEGYRVSGAVRQQVRFQQGNVFDRDFLPGVAIYDAVFCRNVLIYFDRPTQDRALVVLQRLLHAKGALFVAPAETGLPAGHDFVAVNEPLAFAFRKSGGAPIAVKRKAAGHAAAPVSRAIVASPAVVAVPPVAPVVRAALPPAHRGTSDAEPDLKEAARLADQGRFAEAAQICEAHLRRYGPSATAFYLIGLVRDATGSRAEAVSSYRKALYLDANHYDAQIHLALLMEQQGDVAGARVLRDRARRLEQGRGSR